MYVKKRNFVKYFLLNFAILNGVKEALKPKKKSPKIKYKSFR